jgi:dolichol kinase
MAKGEGGKRHPPTTKQNADNKSKQCQCRRLISILLGATFFFYCLVKGWPRIDFHISSEIFLFIERRHIKHRRVGISRVGFGFAPPKEIKMTRGYRVLCLFLGFSL